MHSIPFVNPTGVEYSGLVRVEESTVVVEFRKWSWRKLSNRIVEVHIPIESVTSIQHKKGVVGDRIDLQLRSMQSAGAIPCR